MTARGSDDSPHGQGGSARSDLVDGLSTVAPGALACSTTWKAQEFQRRVLACPNGIVFAVGGVGSGKSEAAALWLLKQALLHPRRKDGNPTRWYIIGPEFSLIRLEQFPKILNHARRLRELGYGSLVRRVVYGMDPKIILRDGQMFLGRSGDQYKRMEGNEVDGAWMDEAQRQPEMAFAIMMTRLRSSDDVRVTVSASPEDSPGWVWRFINGRDKRYNTLRKRMLEEGKGVRIFRWSSHANKTNEAGVLSIIGAALAAASEGAQAQKIGGRFPGTDEAPAVGVIDYSRAFIPELQCTLDDVSPFSLGVDIGETEDFTWISVLSRTGVVLHMERWNAGSPGVPRAGFYPYVETQIQRLAKVWKVRAVAIDIAKAGKPIFQNMEIKLPGISVLGVDTSSPNKKYEVVEALALAVASGDVRIPETWIAPDHRRVQVKYVDQLRKEFEELTPHEKGQGRRSWDHPPGGHDDGIISVALAKFGLGPKRKIIRKGTSASVEAEDDDGRGAWSIGR